MPKSAISFRVPTRLWDAFKAQTDSLFLSRAPFLDYMVRRELANLREELEGLKQSTRAKRHIAGVLKRQDLTSVNIEVQPETADALREATAAHNMGRDAFMSRLVIFLRSTDSLLRYLEVPLTVQRRGIGSSLEDMPTSPLGAMEAVCDDPLFYVRAHVEDVHGCGIYRAPLPPSADWAACYLPDEQVPNTPANRRRLKEEAEFLAIFSDEPQADTKRTARRSSK